MTAPTRRRLRPCQRISCRLAICTALGMIVFHFASPWLEEKTVSLLGLEETVLTTGWIADSLLLRSTKVGPGHWEPHPDALEAFHRDMDEEGSGFVWTSTDDVIICQSADSPWQVGHTWEHTSHDGLFEIDWPGVGPTPAVVVPVEHAGELAGYLLNVLTNREAHADYHHVTVAEMAELDDCWYVDTTSFITDTEAWSQDEQIANVLSIVASAILAILIAATASLLITRRLRRLAEAASTPVSRDGGLPGPFDVRGNDEVADLARALNQMRDRVSELLEHRTQLDHARREWTAQVAHDLRTPLTALLMRLDGGDAAISSAEDVDEVRRRMREILAVARKDAARVHALAEDLLEIGRLDAADALRLEPVPPAELAREAIRGLAPIAGQRSITLDADIERGIPDLRADGRRLLRALQNLLDNAVRHAQGKVRVSVEHTDHGVQFEVIDDGQGFPGEIGEISLDDSSKWTTGDSTGLGLVVARRVAEAHGGRIGAANSGEGGARVWFWVPREQAS